jgi:hypothetical protein
VNSTLQTISSYIYIYIHTHTLNFAAFACVCLVDRDNCCCKRQRWSGMVVAKLRSIHNICQLELLPINSPWTCPRDRVFFDVSIIWGLVGPKRIFGALGSYQATNWLFLVGAIGPILVWLLHKAFSKQS